MRTIISGLVVLFVFVALVGLWRGWFTLSSPNAADGNKINVQLSVDADKVKADAAQVGNKASELSDQGEGSDSDGG